MAEKGKGTGRFRVIEHQPPGAELDSDFQKMKRELEETNRQGWLFGRGAFDSQDIAYLKEHKEEIRSTEQDLEDMATSEFARLRSRAQAEEDANFPQPGVLLLAAKQRKEIKPASKLLPIKRVPSITAKPVVGKPTANKPTAEPVTSPSEPPDAAGSLGKRDREAASGNGGASKLPKCEKDEDAARVSGALSGLLGYSDSEDEGEADEKPGGSCAAGGKPAGSRGSDADRAGAASHALPHPDKLLSETGEKFPVSADLIVGGRGEREAGTGQGASGEYHEVKQVGKPTEKVSWV